MSNIKALPKSKARRYDIYSNETKDVKAMSIEELRASGHFQDWTEDELLNMIGTVRTFTEIVYSAWARQEQTSVPKTNIIPLLHQQRKAA